jgi:hypothetical protein
MLTSDAATYDLASAGWSQTYSNGQYSWYKVWTIIYTTGVPSWALSI